MGAYSLSGSGLLSAGDETIGQYVASSFTQSGGINTVVPGGYFFIGATTGSSGTYSLSGSSLLSALMRPSATTGPAVSRSRAEPIPCPAALSLV